MGKVRVREETNRLYFDFRYKGVRCREYTALQDTPANRKRMESLMKRIEAEIIAGVFDYGKTFPGSRRAERFARPRSTDSAGSAAPPSAQAESPSQTDGPDTPFFYEFIDEWMGEKEVEWKRSYQKKQIDIVNLYLRPEFGKRRVSDITRADLLKYRAALAKDMHGTKPLSGARVNQIMNLLKQVLDEAADRFDFITPYVRIKPVKEGRSKVDPFSLDEVRRFLQEVDPHWRSYFTVRFFTGMRTSEIDGLKWRYVFFDRREIVVEETLVHGQEDTPKTSTSHRAIQMNQLVFDALQEQWERTGHTDGFVFQSKRGEPVRYRNVNNRVWYPTLKNAGLKKRNPYQTRHTAATLWLASGESPEWIARQMGHSNTKMLFTVYSRYVPNLTRQDGSAFERLLARSFVNPCLANAEEQEEEGGHE
ncbi:Arm DNA-binding domain-containing protein [Guyparkeria sp.]|uniref:Arm DNA-binding domain-containing protein n=1 Tax=Guyparkeria sp. TaxID=2035736 RepID=UPI003971079B